MIDEADEARFRDLLARARAASAAGAQPDAFALLHGVGADDDVIRQSRAARCFLQIDPSKLALRPLRLAILAASTMDHFVPILRFWLARAGFAATVFTAPFDTVMPMILDPASALYAAAPDIVWLFSTFRDHELSIPPGADHATATSAVDAAIAARASLWTALRRHFTGTIIDNNADIPADDPFGNLAGAAPWGRRTLLRRYNAELPAALPTGVALFDLDQLAATYGSRRWTDPRYWFHSRHAFAPAASGPVAHAASRLIAALRGTAKKCLVLDLDNTLWGGVAADDGIAGIALGHGADGEAFVAFQRTIKALAERGVILAACSKNDHAVAAAILQDHPDGVLRMQDFAAFAVNWDNKADNIRRIATTLQIGLDAMVFVDDNPMERDIVRRHLPEVTVLDLPQDPALFVQALLAPGWFDTAGFSPEDAGRGQAYAANAARTALRDQAIDMDAYLRSLEMVALAAEADAFTRPRVAQLINKSNQFHLTGTRYSEPELQALQQQGYRVLQVRMADRFGDNGLIACVVLRPAGAAMHVDTWVMSCRVLGRTIEAFTANAIAAAARQAGCDHLVARFVPSGRNGLVADLYARLGFTPGDPAEAGTTWTFPLGRAHSPWTTMAFSPTDNGVADGRT